MNALSESDKGQVLTIPRISKLPMSAMNVAFLSILNIPGFLQRSPRVAENIIRAKVCIVIDLRRDVACGCIIAKCVFNTRPDRLETLI